MSEIESYLAELRARLDVDVKRADEIIAEVRTHLETQAAELQTGGLGSDEAMSQAVGSFGEPDQIARQLVEGNARHRRPEVLRAAGAIIVQLSAGFAISGLYGTYTEHDPAVETVARITGLDWSNAGWLLMIITLIPAAFLAGIVGGRRFWWGASAPALFWIGLCWAMSLITWRLQPYGRVGEQTTYALVFPSLSGIVLVFFGWLGIRLVTATAHRSRAVGYVLGLTAAAYVVWLAGRAVALSLDSPEAFGVAIAVAQPALILLLAAALVDGRLGSRAFIVWSRGIFTVGFTMSLAWVALWAAAGADITELIGPNGWFFFAACESVLGLLVIAVYQALRRRRTASPA